MHRTTIRHAATTLGIALLVGVAGALFFMYSGLYDIAARVPHFVISETPRFVGRAVVALASDPDRARWNGQSLSSGQMAKVYGFDDLDGSRPDCWRYLDEVQEAGKAADAAGYR